MISDFYEKYKNKHKLAEGWRRQGRKIFGYYCSYTPEEILAAARIIPVRIRGSSENVQLADAHLPTYCCSYARSSLDQALQGKYSYLDGVVFPKSCDMTRVLPSIWRINIKLPYLYYLPIPGKRTSEAVDFLIYELDLFKHSLEEYTNQTIGPIELKNAIKTYNQHRSLIWQVYEMALRKKPPITGSEMYGILMSALVMPKEEHNVMLKELLSKIPVDDISEDVKVRLMLVGNTFENIGVLEAIEESGGQVVIDDLDIGTRHYDTLVNETIEPMRAIAERYLGRVPCPCKYPATSRMDYILKLAKDYRVKGVILINQKYCDTHLYDKPWIESTLREHGIPMLFVEHSDIGWSGGKFKTMVQAFIEMIG